MAKEILLTKLSYDKIAKKLEDMIKKRIIELGLVKSGRMIDSINVIPDYKGIFNVEAVEYFPYVDEEYKITDTIYKSDEFLEYSKDIIQQDFTEQIEEEFK